MTEWFDGIKDDTQDLLAAFNELLNTHCPFAIVTCRSGLAIDIFPGGGKYLGPEAEGRRAAYTSQNGYSLAKTIRGAIADYRSKQAA